MPNSVHKRLLACRRPISNCGMAASVCARLERRLPHVELGGQPLLEARLGQVQRACLNLHVLPRVFESLFEGAQLDVGRRHFREHHHQRVAILFDRGGPIGIGGFDVRRYRPQKSSSHEALKPVAHTLNAAERAR